MAQRILIADDDPSTLTGLRALLMAWGYEVETAPNGRVALEKIPSAHPAAVITDVVMPVMTGLELLDAVRNTRPSMPVIVLTAHSSFDSLLVATAEGAFAYLPKPVDVAKLKSVIASAVTEAKMETTAS
jgi:two-component system, NtrC family, response regulator GlrR